MTADIHHLSNGIPVLIDVTPHSQAMAAAVYYPVGAAHEDESNNGVAHFLEHMAFKGTKKRTAKQIAAGIEDLGGKPNAFTSHEMTAYYVNGLAANSKKFIEVLTDIVVHSTLPEEEVERERGVILQEIGMYEDDPTSSMWNKASLKAYPGQSFGRPVLGPRDIVGGMTRATLNDFRTGHYHAGNMIVSVAGDVDPSAILRDFEKGLGRLKARPATSLPVPVYSGGEVHEHRPNIKQVNLGVIFNGFAAADQRSNAARLMSIVLGGGMSSRMFTEIRERRGLVYTTLAHSSAGRGHGLTQLFAGTGPDKIGELMPVLADEVRKMTQDLVTPTELKRAKNRIATDLALSEDSVSGRMNSAAQSFITHGRVIETAEKLATYKAITAKQIRDAAQSVFSSEPVIATVGPGGAIMPQQEFKARLAL